MALKVLDEGVEEIEVVRIGYGFMVGIEGVVDGFQFFEGLLVGEGEIDGDDLCEREGTRWRLWEAESFSMSLKLTGKTK